MSSRTAQRAPLVVAGVLLLAALLALLWWLLADSPRGDRPERAATLTAPEAGAAPVPSLPAPAPAPRESLPAAASPAEDAPTSVVSLAVRPAGSLLVRVRWPDRSVAAGIGVVVIDWHRPNATEQRLHATTDAVGEAHFPHVAAGSVTVDLDRCEGTTIELAPDEVQLVEILIAPGVDIEGRVVDMHGEGVADAIVSLSDCFAYLDWQDIARTDADGGFVLVHAAATRYVCARADGFSASDTYAVFDFHKGDPLQIVLRAPCGQVVGTVKGPDGSAVVGALLSLGEQGWPQPGGPTEHVPMGPLGRDAESDAAGAFRFGSVPPGHTTLSVRAAGFAPLTMQLQVPAQQETPAEVVLSPGCSVTGRVTDESGRAVEGALVTASRNWVSPGVATLSDAQGRYLLQDIAPGKRSLNAWHERAGKVTGTVACSLDAIAEWNPVLQAGTVLQGQVIGRGGEPVAGAWISLSPSGAAENTSISSATTEADGRFTALNIKGDPVDVEISAVPEQGPLVTLKDQPRWSGQRVFQIPWSADAANVVRGRIPEARGALGAEFRAALSWSEDRPGLICQARVDDDGSFELGNLPDGSFTFSVRLGSNEMLQRPLVLSGGRVTDLGDLKLVLARLVVRPVFVDFPQAPAMESVSVEVRSAGGPPASWRLLPEGDAWVAATITPGDYDLSLSGPGIGSVKNKVSVPEVAEHEVHVELQRGMNVTLKVCGKSIVGCVAVLSLPGAGPVVRLGGRIDSDGCMLYDACLTPGRYQVELRFMGNLLNAHAFDVSAQPQQLVSWTAP